MKSAYQVWVNHEKLDSVGLVGTSKDSMIPFRLPQIAFINANKETTQLIVQVSNFMDKKGGIYRSLTIVGQQQIQSIREKKYLWNTFLLEVF